MSTATNHGSGSAEPLRLILAARDPGVRASLAALVEDGCVRVVAAVGDVNALEGALSSTDADVLLLDARLSPARWRAVLRAARERQPHLGVVVATPYDSQAIELEARAEGAASVSLPAGGAALAAVLQESARLAASGGISSRAGHD